LIETFTLRVPSTVIRSRMAGGDSPAVQIVLQFSTEESCPSVTVNIRRKTKKNE